jgi:multicomponent Na+:H+ antiporter subunit D|tara:strand:- start:595 stop:1296 length:702 start_codon:yes stop_codon:yes gene_type:complete
MPKTAIFCLIGAASISAFPLFSGFITKSLTLSAVAHEHYTYIWLALVFASAGVLSHSGIKIPFFTFFAHDSGRRPKEAPLHMLLAMGITAFLCIFIGIFPNYLYSILPYDVNYKPYTMEHIAGQLQLLLFALLAFAIIYRRGLHPPEIRAVNLDTDIIYRKLIPSIVLYVSFVLTACFKLINIFLVSIFESLLSRFHHSHGPDSPRAASWPAGAMVISIASLLGLALFVIFFS